MKKLFIFSAVFPPEPVVSSVLSYDIATFLYNKWDVHVFCPPPTRPMGFFFNEKSRFFNKFKLTEINSFTYPNYGIIGRFIESVSFGWKCSRYINKYSTDLIYQNSWPLFAQFFIVRKAKKYKIPVITHIQDIYPESFTSRISILSRFIYKFLMPIDRYILNYSFHVLCISENMKNYLEKSREIDSNKFTVIYNWQDENNFKYDSDNLDSNEYFTYLYLGNLGPVAGVEILIDAFKIYNNSSSKLIIAGSGSVKQRLIDKVNTQNIKNVSFVNVPQNQVGKIQASADVLLLPIKKGLASSSIPSKLPAYMLSRKPILAAIDADSDTAKFISEAQCGLISDAENVNLLADKMRIMAELSKEERKILGNNGYNYAMKIFSKSENLLNIEKIFQKSIPNSQTNFFI